MLARVMPRVELPASRRPMPWDAIALGSDHPPRLVRSSGRRPRARAVPARSRPGQDGQAEARDASARSPGRRRRAARPTCRCACSKPATRRRLATQVSCHQDIAGDGAFSLGMIAEYQEALVHARGLVLSAAVLGSGADRAGACISRPKRQACGPRASAATSTTRCIGCSGSRTSRSSRSITSRSAAPVDDPPPDHAGAVRDSPRRAGPRHRPAVNDGVATTTGFGAFPDRMDSARGGTAARNASAWRATDRRLVQGFQAASV